MPCICLCRLSGTSDGTFIQAFVKRAGPNLRILVAETTNRVGGLIQTKSNTYAQWEEGPNTMLPYDAVLRTAADAGIANELVYTKTRAPRYIYWAGRLHRFTSPLDIVRDDLLSWMGKFRALKGVFGWRLPQPGGG